MAKQLEITDIEIKGLKPRDKVFTKHFGGGFYVYVLPTGRKVCRYCYQAGGKIKRYELGDYVAGKGKLKELVAEYNRVHSNRIHNKVDPVDEILQKEMKTQKKLDKKKKKQAKAQAKKLKKEGRITLDDVAVKFLKKYQGLKTGDRPPAPRTMKDYASNLDRIAKVFGQYPMDDLPEEKIMDYLDDIATDSKVMANRLFSTLSVVCTWSVKQKRYNIKKNPFAGMDKPGGKEKSKDRTLDFRPKHKKFQDKGEIRRFWQWLDTINPAHAIAYKMILMTGLRPGEVLGLEWQDIDDDEIILPKEKTKRKTDIFIVPLTPKLKELLDDLKSIDDTDGFLFKAKKYKKGESVEGESVPTDTLARRLSNALASGGALHGIEGFTPHDLRRACGTHIVDSGFSKPEVDWCILDHAQGAMSAIYIHADETPKKKEMLEKWHRRLDQLTNGDQDSNVVAIR